VGIGKPYAQVPLDLAGDPHSQLPYAKPLYENMLDKTWTLFNTRSLRENFNSYSGIDPGLERMIFAYDYIILIPDPAASHPLVVSEPK
jgi:hypothetical protein